MYQDSFLQTSSQHSKKKVALRTAAPEITEFLQLACSTVSCYEGKAKDFRKEVVEIGIENLLGLWFLYSFWVRVGHNRGAIALAVFCPFPLLPRILEPSCHLLPSSHLEKALMEISLPWVITLPLTFGRKGKTFFS